MTNILRIRTWSCTRGQHGGHKASIAVLPFQALLMANERRGRVVVQLDDLCDRLFLHTRSI
jgi:hypothetical protein